MATLYVCGPMTGLPDYNYPAFHEAAARLRKLGWTVLNPAENFGGDQTLPYGTYMSEAVKQVASLTGKNDAIALLPGWEKSRGATMEALIAQRMGVRVLNAMTGGPMAIPELTVRLAPEPVEEPTKPDEDYDGTVEMWLAEDAVKQMHNDLAREGPVCGPLDERTSTIKRIAVNLPAGDLHRVLQEHLDDLSREIVKSTAPQQARSSEGDAQNTTSSTPRLLESQKPTNPKDLIGSNKVPMYLFPATAIALGSLAMLDGALKYGRDNFRAIGVRATIYVDAALRHIYRWLEGNDLDQDSGLHELAHALACLAILVDAEEAGMLNDDRKIKGGFLAQLNELTPDVKRLRELHADKSPKHYTIADSR